MLDGRLRNGVQRGLTPVGAGLRRIGVTADLLTVLGLLAAIATAVLIATGNLIWGVVGLAFSGLLDVLDGTVARGSGNAGPRGAFFDSVTDRVSDALLLGGVAWYLAGTSTYAPILAFAVAALGAVISYERAKGEALGFSAKGGLMERAERMILLGVGLAFNILIPVLWVMLVLSAATAVQRFAKVWRQASPPRKQRTRRIGHRRDLSADDLSADETERRRWWEPRPGSSRARRERTRAGRRTRP